MKKLITILFIFILLLAPNAHAKRLPMYELYNTCFHTDDEVCPVGSFFCLGFIQAVMEEAVPFYFHQLDKTKYTVDVKAVSADEIKSLFKKLYEANQIPHNDASAGIRFTIGKYLNVRHR